MHKINSLDLNHAVIKLPSDVNCYGTIGYLINKNSKLKIFNLLFNRSTLGLPIDNILCSLNQAHLINSYILLPTLLYPFPDSFNSHSVSGNHPLADDWVNFRKLISMHNSTSESIEKELTKIITNRLKFSIYNKFNPINKLV